jgi:hypothetical protein
MDDTSRPGGEPGSVRISGETPLTVPWTALPERHADEISRRRIGFECASGDWIERTWLGIPMFALLEDGALPPDTTHVRIESIDDVAACVPITVLAGGFLALGAESEFEEFATSDEIGPRGEYPRFVSPAVVGPRTIKQVSLIEPLALDPGTDRTEYETLPE